ncbi:MAG: M23 family metallopeptidase [Labilithrix sp.]|nr:M23 family metallopeptidase [Labilithrix sp.]MCW5817080.1 M23 family metallopeptidase [Labilithrix sp.]
MSQESPDSELEEERAPDSAPDSAADAADEEEEPVASKPAPTPSKPTPSKPEKGPPPSLRLRRLPPLKPDRTRLYTFGAMGLLVATGVGLMIASPKRLGMTPPPLALTSGEVGDDAGAGAVAAVTIDAGTIAKEAAPVVRPPPVWRVASMKDEAGVDVVEGTFGKKGLVAALTAAGLTRAEIKRLNRAFEDVKHIDRPGANDKFVLAKDKKGSVLAFEYITSPYDVWQARVDPADLADAAAKEADAGATPKGKPPPPPDLDAKKLALFVEHKRVGSAIVVAADLAKTIAAANMRPELVDEIDDALEGHVEDGIRPGARMRVVSTEDWVEGVFAKVKLEAIEMAPRAGNTIRVYYYERGPDVDGPAKQRPAAGFYDAKGRQPYHGQFRPPLQLSRITSRFNPNRMHPVLHVVMPHNGVDFAGSTGTPIFASAAGTVTSAGDSGPCGNMVSIDHGGGITTAYCHMSKIAPGIRSGVKVESRQNIGFVGMTGRVTGPHLHFVVKRNGQFIDPMSLKMDGVRVLPPADRESFARKRADLDAVLDAVALPAAPSEKEAPPDVEEDKDLHE